ncbi:MAG: TIGR01459 family HAD-type hydrolase [Rhodospirillales bacterium]|jgi:HAD superfamily hydrolase (TIGR01459 family)|nr:TIGR01459 family HAD-type hydrolase [Rhodospirillales bacterium]MBT4006598.1 TIGR01459 family HAD-type hydrolase [Rhodospirillales bacterium]MBT5075823.1 TIGR01459 family HAD-type hydrolase [Rhodospirillales bacterium]MBT5113876.1 TIGR01459 family HAD-type hydrolase [Rhodospirillales bacterium]MBT5672404.1 TIGR01459 family HAD-type hydrolase [Rhodospirillales bacterium]
MTANSTIKILPRLGPLVEGYDGLILDLWGVIHDGRTPYPGVSDTLGRLKDAGKKVVMLSNAPRRAAAVIDAMTEMGIDRGLYTDVLSSGELSWHALKNRSEGALGELGDVCLHVGPDRDLGLMDGLGLEIIKEPVAGAFILNTGPWQDDEQVSDYEPLLSKAASLGLPMVCANPDIEVIRAGNRIICAGSLAHRYAALKGTVHYFGKPYALAYEACLALMDMSDKSRILAVGDSLKTDILGACNAGVDSVLVTSGIHGEELGVGYGETVDGAVLETLCARQGAVPIAAIPAFLW